MPVVQLCVTVDVLEHHSTFGNVATETVTDRGYQLSLNTSNINTQWMLPVTNLQCEVLLLVLELLYCDLGTVGRGRLGTVKAKVSVGLLHSLFMVVELLTLHTHTPLLIKCQ